MSDKEEDSVVAGGDTNSMAEAEEPQQQQPLQDESKKPEKMNISFRIWPPTQRTRDAVINRLVETLSTPSVLSKRYGSLPADEAAAAARLIEEDAFSTAASNTTENDDIEILQVYSKEISKRMLEAVKARGASASSPDKRSPIPVAADAATPATSEENSSVVTESS